MSQTQGKSNSASVAKSDDKGVNSGSAVGVQKGGFTVGTKIHDDDESGHVTPGVDVRKTGRFVVVTEPDEDEDSGFNVDDKERVVPSQSTNIANGIAKTTLSENQISQPDIPSLKLQGTVCRGSSQVSSETTSPELSSDGSVGRSENDVLVSTHQNRASKQISPSVVFAELQKISAQNRKLHGMLLNLSVTSKDTFSGGKHTHAHQAPENHSNVHANNAGNSEAIDLDSGNVPSVHDPRRQSLNCLEPQVSGGVYGTGTNGNLEVASLSGATSASARRVNQERNANIPKFESTVRLQNLAQQLNVNTMSISQEYDALKMRNFALTKRLKETQKQLAEANLLIENLKQKISKTSNQ